MKAALWVKLKASGPILSFDQEFRRFKPWIPDRLMPLTTYFWLCYSNTPGIHQSSSSASEKAARPIQVAERLDIEHEVLTELYRRAAEFSQYPILCQFIERLMDARAQSLDARQKLLAGQKIDSDFDDQLYANLLLWLGGFRHSKQREIAGWLERLLVAWWYERTYA